MQKYPFEHVLATLNMMPENKAKHEHYKRCVEVYNGYIKAIETQIALDTTRQSIEYFELEIKRLDAIAALKAKENYLDMYAKKVFYDTNMYDRVTEDCNAHFEDTLTNAEQARAHNENIDNMLKGVKLEEVKEDQTKKNELYLFLNDQMTKMAAYANKNGTPKLRKA